MKYVWIFVAVVILVRIDFVIKLIEDATTKVQTPKQVEVKAGEVETSEVISLKNDVALKGSPRKTFLNMLEDFRNDPSSSVSLGALEILRANPQILSQKLDPEFEAAVYRWRDLLYQKNRITHVFLLGLLDLVKGENQDMLRRFYSLAIDVDVADFFTAYARSKDTTCQIGSLLGDQLSEDERYNELAERYASIEQFLKNEKLDVPVKVMALRCEAALKLTLEKLRIDATPESPVTNPAPEAVPVPTPTPDPVSTPAPAPIPAPVQPQPAPGPTL